MPRRCPWSEGVNDAYLRYHDEEWGVPVHEDRIHFEFLILEGAQAGLSWSTILNKRAAYRRAYLGFDPLRVARFNRRSVARLRNDAGIVRNRLKIEASITNARAFVDIQEEFGSFDHYVWRFVDGVPLQHGWREQSQVPATSPESDALSRISRREVSSLWAQPSSTPICRPLDWSTTTCGPVFGFFSARLKS